MQLQLHQWIAIGTALLATSAHAAPTSSRSESSNQRSKSPLAYGAVTGAGSVSGGAARQALFSVSMHKRDTHTLGKRRPSQALEAVINYVRRITAVPEDDDDDDDEDDEGDNEDDEQDGSDPAHYYKPIGRGNAQKPFGAPSKRASNGSCGAKASTTSTTAKSTSTSKAATSSSKTTTTAKTTSSSIVRVATTTTAAATTKAATSTSKAATATATASASAATGKGGAGLVTGYWPSWAASKLPPESIAWSKFDIVFYAFAIPTSSGAITIDDSSMLKRFVKAAKAGNTKAVLSLGGWGQSSGFSKSVASDSARAKFITNVLNVISTYNLDGVDFDWEYPGNVQGGTDSPTDTANFQTFLQQLRAKIPQGKLMTAAVPQQVWQASNGNPVGSVARAGGALDHIVIMNYDVWGSSSTPGPNAPLGNLCGNSTQPVASAAGGVKAWTSAGFPREKILLGVPSYGYINTSAKRRLVQRDTNSVDGNAVTLIPDRPDSNSDEGKLQRRAALKNMDGSTGSGQINFNSLVSQGVLKLDSSTGTYVADGGYTKYWDDCSDTPYLANGQTVVTYDDPDSLYDKGDFARLAGISGIAMWSIDGDMTGNVLINSLVAGLKGSS